MDSQPLGLADFISEVSTLSTDNIIDLFPVETIDCLHDQGLDICHESKTVVCELCDEVLDPKRVILHCLRISQEQAELIGQVLEILE